MGRRIEFDRGRLGLLLLLAVVGPLAWGFAAQKANAQDAQQEAAAAEEAADTAAVAMAADPTAALKTEVKVWADTIWVLVTGMLVFFMNLGFACVESGFCRAKNAVNILSKNFIVFAVTSLFFWLLGFGLMFGNGSPYVGQSGLWRVGGA